MIALVSGNAVAQTQFVPGWAIAVPLLLLVVILVCFFVAAMREEPSIEEQTRDLYDLDEIEPYDWARECDFDDRPDTDPPEFMADGGVWR